ncbi:MAG: YfiR family protein [Candidatus Marinimicrobia bacterium]|nr:YfiR family protein [Candidatus Neomarinimicrobiota bacterium]
MCFFHAYKITFLTLYHTAIIRHVNSKGFANEGVAINFVTVEGKIRFEINIRALESAGLRVSSQLLKLAILVK